MSFPLEYRVLLVPGLNDSGPEHWQSRWQSLYPAFDRLEQADWSKPELASWTENLATALQASDEPTIVVAHSFGCLATVNCASKSASNIVGALLVAPADPEKFLLSDQLKDIRLPFPSILIGSENDPWMSGSKAAIWAQRWRCDFINGGKLGHINAESKLGDWLYGLSKLQHLALNLHFSSISRSFS